MNSSELDNLEYLNTLRIKLYNSKEYSTGTSIENFKKLIANKKILEALKHIYIHYRIKGLSKITKNDEKVAILDNTFDLNNKRIVVYTCITGNYDNVLEPLFPSKDIDYFLFTDTQKQVDKNSKWQIKSIDNLNIDSFSHSEKNRYLKLNPNKIFKDNYDYSIYIDGNIQVVLNPKVLINRINPKYGIALHKHRCRNDIYTEYKVCKLLNKGNKINLNKQIEKYKKENFPSQYGMAEANVIVTDLKNEFSSHLFSDWWDEYISSKSGRDQMSLPYVLWKNNIKVSEISTLGDNIYKNPLFFINIHKES